MLLLRGSTGKEGKYPKKFNGMPL